MFAQYMTSMDQAVHMWVMGHAPDPGLALPSRRPLSMLVNCDFVPAMPGSLEDSSVQTGGLKS